QRVSAGDVLLEVETDKATIEVEAPADGTLAIVAPEGAIVPVDGLLAELRQDGAAAPPANGHPRRQAPFASPAARRLAREHGVDLASVRGSGPGGRIVARD